MDFSKLGGIFGSDDDDDRPNDDEAVEGEASEAPVEDVDAHSEPESVEAPEAEAPVQMGSYQGRQLERSATGDDVRDVQRALRLTGAELEANGTYGQETEDAVRAFQRTVGARTDGVVGPVTWRLLRRAARGADPR